MYRVLDESSGHAVGIKVSGTLTKEDYEVLIPYFKDLVGEYGPLNLLCEMSEFDEINIDAFWKGFKSSFEHVCHFTRIAVIGDHRRFHWNTALVTPVVKTELRFFPLENRHEAWEWVRA